MLGEQRYTPVPSPDSERRNQNAKGRGRGAWQQDKHKQINSDQPISALLGYMICFSIIFSVGHLVERSWPFGLLEKVSPFTAPALGRQAICWLRDGEAWHNTTVRSY